MPATTTTSAPGAPPAASRAPAVPRRPSAPPWSSASDLVSCRPVQTSYRGSPQNQLLLHAPHGRHESTETEFLAPRALSTCPAATPPAAQLHSIALTHSLQREQTTAGKSLAARMLLKGQIAPPGRYVAGQATPGTREAVPFELAHSRASEPRPSTVVADRGSSGLQPAHWLQGLLNIADTAPLPFSSSLRATAAAFKPGARAHVAGALRIRTVCSFDSMFCRVLSLSPSVCSRKNNQNPFKEKGSS